MSRQVAPRTGEAELPDPSRSCSLSSPSHPTKPKSTDLHRSSVLTPARPLASYKEQVIGVVYERWIIGIGAFELLKSTDQGSVGG